MRLYTNRIALFVPYVSLFLPVDAADYIPNVYSFCIKYYGSVSSEIELPDSIPQYNYNGSDSCPTPMRFPVISGATLEICPPSGSTQTDDPTALSAELRLSHTSGELTDPVDNLRLAPFLIINGSVPGPFDNNGRPAILAHDAAREQSSFVPVWTINGTEASLIDSPGERDHTQGVYFGCRYNKSPYYCGSYEDLHEPPPGGCWSSQMFNFNMRNPLNFTIRFSDNEASAEIWATSPYVLYTGEETGSETTAYISFGGNREVPSVVDYDFWTNSESNYEIETDNAQRRAGMKLEMGADDLPVLVDDTETGESFAAGNGTFSSLGSRGMSSFKAGQEFWAIIALASAIVLGFA